MTTAPQAMTEAEIEAFRKGQKVFVSEMYHAAIDQICNTALAHLSAGGWREISSAPKDGTVVALWDGYVKQAGRFNRYNEHWWTTDSRSVSPTHWCELPPTPSGKEPGEPMRKDVAWKKRLCPECGFMDFHGHNCSKYVPPVPPLSGEEQKEEEDAGASGGELGCGQGEDGATPSPAPATLPGEGGEALRDHDWQKYAGMSHLTNDELDRLFPDPSPQGDAGEKVGYFRKGEIDWDAWRKEEDRRNAPPSPQGDAGEQYHSWDCKCDHPELHPSPTQGNAIEGMVERAENWIVNAILGHNEQVPGTIREKAKAIVEPLATALEMMGREVERLRAELRVYERGEDEHYQHAIEEASAAQERITRLTEATTNAVEAIDLIQRKITDEPLGDLNVDDFLSALNSALNNCRSALAVTREK